MNSGEPSAQPEDAAGRHDDGHPAFLAHHFESPGQQFDAGKLGMWIFLVTEVLFFSGLFVAYAVYRNNHPEVFVYAHQYLEKSLGALNTVVLLFSSLTMAWGVRCAQLGQQRGLILCLAATLASAGLFLGVKAVEYSHKWDVGLLWAGRFAPAEEHGGEGTHGLSSALLVFSAPALAVLAGCLIWAAVCRARKLDRAFVVSTSLAVASLMFFVGVAAGKGIPLLQRALVGHSQAEQANHGEGPRAQPAEKAPGGGAEAEAEAQAPKLAGVFFSIYFSMTGVHALHVIGGMIAIAWLVWRATLGVFGRDYFGPVDYVGLYWHFVDLAWIYLFPLLYLIH
jgi:cytochrome c oxidase subunit 3